MIKKIFIFILFCVSLYGNVQLADDIGFVDDITINGREFESLEQRTIEFYEEDLKDGKVVITGLLESTEKTIGVDDLFVEISTNGGKSWFRASGHDDWEFSFEPKIGYIYEFSLRVVRESSTLDNTLEFPNQFNISGFVLSLNEGFEYNGTTLSGNGTIYVPWLQNFGLEGNINVEFNNLTFEEDRITSGNIEYTSSLQIVYEDITLDISKLVFNAQDGKNTLVSTLSSTSNELLSSLPNTQIDSLIFDTNGITGIIAYSNDVNFDIWEEQNVKVSFRSLSIDFSLKMTTGLKLGISNLDASLKFGNLLGSIEKRLEIATDELGKKINGVYSWSENSKQKLIDDGTIFLSQSVGKLNLEDLSNPKIVFDTKIDLSQYGSLFSNINEISIKDVVISKTGLSSEFTTALNPISIWEEQNVNLVFNGDIGINLSLKTSGVDININTGDIQLEFGNLFDSATAELLPLINEAGEASASKFSWVVSESKSLKSDVDILLSQLSGELDLSNLTNPIISFNANANLSSYGGLLSKIELASITDAQISKEGLSASLGILIDSLDIWKGKGVKLQFSQDSIPTLNLSLSILGELDFFFENFDATVDFGTLLPDTVASLESLQDGTMDLVFNNPSTIYLLNQKNKLEQLDANLDLSKLDNPKISFTSSLKLLDYTGVLSQIETLDIQSALISKDGFEASASASLRSIDIWEEKNVKLKFNNSPIISLSIGDKLDFSIDDLDASLDFGDLFDGATTRLNALQDEANNIVANTYSWGITSSKQIVSDAKEKLKDLNGSLNLQDLENPNIVFNANLDLSSYGGAFASIENARVSDAKISKNGLSAQASLNIEHINIYKEKNVKVQFNSNPTLKLSLTTSGYNVGLFHLDASIDFGTLIPNATASMKRVLTTSEIQNTLSDAEDIYNQGQSFIEDDYQYSWDLSGSYNLYGNEILLSSLGGTIDFSILSNPVVSLDANISFNEKSFLYSYAQNVELLSATISKDGFTSKIQTQLNDIPIWNEKNVKLDFNESDFQKLSLGVSSSGFKISLDEFNAELDFGTLINDTKTRINTLSAGLFSWDLGPVRKTLLNSSIKLKNLLGTIDLTDMKNPIINLDGAINLSSYSSCFESVGDIILSNAQISKSSFKTELSAQLEDIPIYQEKNVKLIFNDSTIPSFNFEVDRDGIDFGVKNISAKLDFGDLLNGEILTLRNKVNSATNKIQRVVSQGKREVKDFSKKSKEVQKALDNLNGIYTWSVSGSKSFLSDSNGSIVVSNLAGELNLQTLSNPIIDFHALADFTNYNLAGFDFDAEVEVEKAKISKSGIEWNLGISNGSTEFTVLDLGVKEEDVRVELFNINASTGTAGTQVSSAAGTLFLGNKLFDGTVEPIALAYDGTKYTFSSTQELTYTYENTVLKIANPTGSVSKIGDKYEVVFSGNAQFFTDILKNVGVPNINLSGLKISSTGFKADLNTTFEPIQKHTLLGDKVKLSLSSIGIKIDSTLDIPIIVNSIDGEIDLSSLFNEAEAYAKTAIAYTNSQLTFDFNEKILHLGLDNKFEFKGLSGSFNMNSLDELSMSLSGNFGYKEWENIDLALEDFTISSSGISGTIGLGEVSTLETTIANLVINELSISFLNTTNVSGNIKMHYSKDGFLGSSEKFTFDMGTQISLDGVDSFSLDSNALKAIPIENFATMTLLGVETNLDMEDFSLSFNGTLQPNHSLLSSLSAVEFDGLEISKDGISIDSISSTQTISGASFDLAGMTLTLTELGLGYKVSEELLFFEAAGSLNLGITEAGAGMTFYSNGTYDINQIELNVSEPAIILSGKFDWYDADPTYGEGFAATGLNLGVGGIFNVEGAFRIGEKSSKRYWMARALYSSSAGVPLTPIPISLYGFGGGASYGMEIQRSEDSFDTRFIPNGTEDIIVTALVKMGTSDVGYTWHGTLGMDINLATGVTRLDGISYLLSDLSLSPEERVITAEVVLGTSPFEISIDGGVDVKYLASDFELVHLFGNGALAYTSARKYVHLGTKNEPITSRIFDLAQAQSYLVIESDLFALGSRFSSSDRWSKWGFGIGYDTNIGFDLEAGFGRKVYIDLQAYLRMAIEARVPVKGWFDLASVNGKVRFRSPSPTIFSLFLKGCAIGKCAKHTFYIVGKKPSSLDNQNMSILKEVEPFHDTDFSLKPLLKLGTVFPNDGTMQEVGRENYWFTITNVKLVDTSNPTVSKSLNSSRIDNKTIGYMPQELLRPNTQYKLTADVQWLRKNNIDTNVLEKVEKVEKIFTTTDESFLPYSELVAKVMPETGSKDISSTAKVRIYYSHLAKELPQMNNNYVASVINSKNEVLEGTWNDFSWDTNKGKFGEILENTVLLPGKKFTPNEPFNTYHFCLNNSTGEIKETVVRSDGKYYNPFRSYTVDGEDDGMEFDSLNIDNSGLSRTTSLNNSRLSNNMAARVTAQSLGVSEEIFTDLNLGEPSVSNDSFTYYSTNKYMIKVKDVANDKIVYISFFEAKGSGNQGDQFVYLTNNINDIDAKIDVERSLVVKDGQEYNVRAIISRYEQRAMGNQFPVCDADTNLGELAAQYGNPISRTCATCGDCEEHRTQALAAYKEHSPNIRKVTINSGINRNEYPNVFPVVDVVYEDELNPENTLSKQYTLLYGDYIDNLYQLKFDGIEKIKEATIKYYIAQENTFGRLLSEGRIEPVVTKQVIILDSGLDDITRANEDSKSIYENNFSPENIQLNSNQGVSLW
ncbi:hypothetical protein [Arcobacter arenosus]|uniref:Autotransporter domain-containing protein n=1 Tax=Arcobacter arenosus TaxID=2576037 RepID=A0A5R8Y4D4_9BACT|nr:hypothetical protein [Arcobacter arenosus]TLP40513.1 hypothetical protein FDK22_00435 [Arcobacter arenosus]